MKLPGEDELKEHIRSELYSEFQIASDLLSIGTDLFKSFTIDSSNMPGYDEFGVCLGIVAKACKQYRAILGLAELGLGDVSASNCRMLIDTSLAAQFLMRDELELRRGKKTFPDVPGYPFTTAFRTQLYLANDALHLAKTLRGLCEEGVLHSDHDKELLRSAEQHAAEQCEPIGVEWTGRLKSSGSFSGVNILDLAESLGRRHLYAAFYRPVSLGVHGADARQSADILLENDGRLSIRFPTKSDGIADAIKLASHAFLDVLQVASLRFGLQITEPTRQLRLRVQQMKEG